MRGTLIPFAFAGAWLVQSCVPGGGGFVDAGELARPDGDVVLSPIAETIGNRQRFDLGQRLEIDGPLLPSTWHPRMHPPGTILIDASHDLWMVVTGLERRPIAGDDVLGEVGLGDDMSIRMTAEEERCLAPVADGEYWYPPNYAWRPFYGPFEDENLYLVDWELGTRRLASLEALESWGYSAHWIDNYDGDMDDWNALTELEEPLRFRDGSIAHTELATYYLLYGRAYVFNPQALVQEVGYRSENMIRMPEARLRELAVVTTDFRRDYFDRCPSEGSSED